jgi:hypothetical protein
MGMNLYVILKNGKSILKNWHHQYTYERSSVASGIIRPAAAAARGQVATTSKK